MITSFDIGVFIFIFLSGLLGFWRGLTREILGIGSWALSLIATYFIWNKVFYIANHFIENYWISLLVSIVGVFVLAMTFFSAFTDYLSSKIKQSIIGGLDRSLGFVYGVARGILISFVGIFLFLKLVNPINRPEFIKDAQIVPWVNIMFNNLKFSLPQNFSKLKDKFNYSNENIEEEFNPISNQAVQTFFKVNETVQQHLEEHNYLQAEENASDYSKASTMKTSVDPQKKKTKIYERDMDRLIENHK